MKVGDNVRVIDNGELTVIQRIYSGYVGTIVRIDDTLDVLGVEFSDGEVVYFVPENLELVDQPTDIEGATKHDSGKASRPELIAPEMITALGEILAFGAQKYDDNNWLKGMKWSRCFGAAMRHLWSWWSPVEDSNDPETGKSHLWHAAACIMFLIAYEARGIGEDDRV